MKKISSVIAGMLLMLCTICISPVYAPIITWGNIPMATILG